jgi:hypothetical protein
MPLRRDPADLGLTNDFLALDVRSPCVGSPWPVVAPPAVVAGRLLPSESPAQARPAPTPTMPLPDPLVPLAGRMGPLPASILEAMACSCPLRRRRAGATISALRRARSRHRARSPVLLQLGVHLLELAENQLERLGQRGVRPCHAQPAAQPITGWRCNHHHAMLL